jgi:hypothetical protein
MENRKQAGAFVALVLIALLLVIASVGGAAWGSGISP